MQTHVETTHALSLQSPLTTQSTQSNSHSNQQIKKTPGQKLFQNQGENTISSIVSSYKSAVTKHAHRLGFEFDWQSRFYDNIINDQASYNTISKYIINNLTKWEDDKLQPSKPNTEI